YREGKNRRCRKQDPDQVAGRCLGGQSFGQSRNPSPQLAERESAVRSSDRDAVAPPADHLLELLDDRLLQILCEKGGEGGVRGSLPIKRPRVVVEPRKRQKCVEVVVPNVGARIAWRGVQS